MKIDESQKAEASYDAIREYYGRTLNRSADLKTSACCSTASVSAEQAAALSLIAPEVIEKFYGCGSPIPPLMDGCTVLDLGCGSGRDAFVASRLVGSGGRVVGIDMTEEQLEVASRHVPDHTRRFGYSAPNVEFRHGYIENLSAAGIADNSVDVVISNCVINLSPDKRAVFSEIFRVLKTGGELYFSDVFAGSRVPEDLKEDPVLLGECLSGALYVEDFRRIMREVGFMDHRVTAKAPIQLGDTDVEKRIGMVAFHSITVRAFKLANLEDICEDYGQAATYRGSIPGHPHRFDLDDHHRFTAGKPALVCGNTASMLSGTRYGSHFRIVGDRRTHYGPFDCAPSASGGVEGEGSSCC